MGNNGSRDALEGRGAVVTGANSGVGFAVVKKLLGYGMVVVGMDSETDKLDELKVDKKFTKLLHVVQNDISDEEEILDAFQWVSDNIQNVDVLVHTAENTSPCSILDGNRKDWMKMANSNILGMCSCTVEMVRTMKEQNIDLGLIVVVNSIAGCEISKSSAYHFYSATKHASARLTEHLRQELEFGMIPIKITSITIGPHEYFETQEKFSNNYMELENKLQIDDVITAIDYVVYTPAHLQVRDLQIVSNK